jgi:hypothetical protein
VAEGRVGVEVELLDRSCPLHHAYAGHLVRREHHAAGDADARAIGCLDHREGVRLEIDTRENADTQPHELVNEAKDGLRCLARTGVTAHGKRGERADGVGAGRLEGLLDRNLKHFPPLVRLRRISSGPSGAHVGTHFRPAQYMIFLRARIDLVHGQKREQNGLGRRAIAALGGPRLLAAGERGGPWSISRVRSMLVTF